MSNNQTAGLSRRDLMKTTGTVAAASALASVVPKHVYAGENNTIQIALVGCGGRGTGAAANALSTTSGPVKLVAMADVFNSRLNTSHRALTAQMADKIDVPKEQQFIGFDAYKKAMDSLNPGDVVILTTPPAFRWVQYTYAIERGLNVFMEKPVCVDGFSAKKMFALNKEAKKKDLKVGVGLMCRHCEIRGELFDKIQAGELGDLIMLRAYRMAGPTGSAFVRPKPVNDSELMYQIKNFHGFLWASGGAFSDFLIHNIDECCWMKNDFPIEAKASGGRHYRGEYVDQNFDAYSTEFTFPDGSKIYLEGRCMTGCHQEFATYVHGSKGSAVVSARSHTPARSRIYKGQKFAKDEIVWQGPKREPNPYQLEWDHLIQAIRKDQPYNEVDRGTEASLVTAMGRMAAHTGRVITREEALNAPALAPDVDKLTLKSDAPVQAKDGKYPVPMPGIIRKSEYAV